MDVYCGVVIGTLQGFAAQRNLSHMPLEPLLDHIKNKLGMKVIIDKAGDYRVDIPAQNPDEIQYKRGSKEVVEKIKTHNFGSDAEAKRKANDVWEAKQAKLQLAGCFGN